MYRNNRIISFTVLLFLFLTACQVSEDVEQTSISNEQPIESAESTETNEPNIKQPEKSDPPSDIIEIEETHEEYSLIDETFLPNLAIGKIKYCDFTLEDKVTITEVIDKLGTPEYESFYNGGYGRRFGDCSYFAEDKDLDSTVTTMFYISKKFKLSLEEIKNILGSPSRRGINEMTGEYYMSYISGEYSASFTFANEGAPVGYIFIK